jgi:hypothetical protein
MHSAILLSSNHEFSQPCSIVLAQQLLRQGLAKIVQFYPLTVQFKGEKPEDDMLTLTTGNKPPRMDVAKKSLISESL